MQSPFGKFLDPVADKLLASAVAWKPPGPNWGLTEEELCNTFSGFKMFKEKGNIEYGEDI